MKDSYLNTTKNVYKEATIYYGDDELFDYKRGYMLLQNQLLAVCDKTANNLASLGRDDIFISESAVFYDGGGCC